ncbi:carboxymuconolactone decarboxylase family protein [Streptomyces sp. PmtG]
MNARMDNPAQVLDATPALLDLVKAANKGGVPQEILDLVHLRASQINGCSFCVIGGALQAKKRSETDERLFAVAAWREAPYFSDAERAALALAEAGTRLADSSDPVPDDVWIAAARHFDEKQLASIVLWIGITNLFNRLNTLTKQPGGQTW